MEKKIQMMTYLWDGLERNSKMVFQKSSKNKRIITIDFYLIDSFEIFHYLPIYKELLNQGINATIVAEPCNINTAKNWFDYETAVKILKELNLEYSIEANIGADIAITTQHSDILSKYKNKKVALSYGFGLNRNSFAHIESAAEGFDYKLIHGEFTKNIVKNYLDEDRLLPIGFPKHDEFFKNKPARNYILTELNIKTDKPIIVYFPTYDEDSSISEFCSALKELKKDYFIVTKAHHCTFRLEHKKDDLRKLYEISDLVLEGNYSFSNASLIGDIVLADAKSGSAIEVSYLNNDVPLIMLSPQKDLKKYFYEDIFELGYLINDPNDIRDAIKEIIKEDKYKQARIAQLEYILGKSDGQSAKKAVESIKFIIDRECFISGK